MWYYRWTLNSTLKLILSRPSESYRKPVTFLTVDPERIQINSHGQAMEEDSEFRDAVIIEMWHQNYLLNSWQSDDPSHSQGKKPRHIPDQLLWTFNYSVSWKMEDPGVLCNYVLYLARSPEFYLIAHYVGTIVNCCWLCPGIISLGCITYLRREENPAGWKCQQPQEIVEHCNSQKGHIVHNAWQDSVMR